MEPTIYKPSIYKGAGIYKAGAEGGGGGGGDVAEIGGKKYNITKIGSQIWTCENIDWAFNGCVIGGAVSDTEPRGNYYNDDELTYKENGLLYNYPALVSLNDKLTGGWRVPSVDDFNLLKSNCNTMGGGDVYINASNTGWLCPGGSNITGLSLKPSGVRVGAFYSITTYCCMGTITEDGAWYYRHFEANADTPSTDVYANKLNNAQSEKNNQVCVRLVKDA